MLLVANGLSRSYGRGDARVEVLRDVSFTIAPGEFVAIMGPSGSGKSTLLNLVGLLDQPTSGALSLAGHDVTRLTPDAAAALRNREIGFVFQSYNLLARSTVSENVALPLVYSGVPGQDRERAVREALAVVGLADKAARWPAQLSGGEQQRVAIARALVISPSLLLADEPTGALDSRTGLEILALFQQLHHAGRSIVMVTHDDAVARHASRIIRLWDGAIVSDERVPRADAAAQVAQEPMPPAAPGPHRRARMGWRDTARIATRALGANKLRSFLTMLGVIVGVASVITMVAVGSGAQTQIDEQIRTLGANLLMVFPGAAQSGGVRMESGTRHTLSESDAQAISQLPTVRVAAPAVRGAVQIVRGNRNWNTLVTGTTSQYLLMREWPVAAGRHFLPQEEENADRLAIIGATVAKELFGEQDPVGGNIRVLNTPLKVIGVLAEKGMSGGGRNQDDVVFVPISTAKTRLIGSANQVNPEAVAFILVKAVSQDRMRAATQDVEALLRQRHRLAPGDPSDFRVTNPADAMALRNAAAGTLTWLLASIASVSLIVGGISIMNIMLVSVTERTREIGLRLAVGARRRDVRAQFLIEAVMLCLLGGAVGIALGVAASFAVARLAGWPIFVSPQAVAFAAGFAAAVGVFFGWYPARKAATLSPVQALRTE